MISREQLKIEIDSVDDAHIEILYRIIQSLKISVWASQNPSIFSDFNSLKDSIIFENDLISPIDVSWYAE
mgnify:CR=1 FL=1